MKRAREVTALVVVAALVGGLIAAVLINRSSADRAARQRAVRAYADVVKPLGVEGGRLVQQEIKPALTDLRQGTITPEEFRTDALRWLTSLRRLRTLFVNSEHPAQLNETARLYGEAMDGYIAAVEAWIAASRKPTQAARNEAIAAAADIAEAADDAYDRARAALTREMELVGLNPPEL